MATFLSRLPRTLTLASYLSRSFSTTASVAHSRSSSLFLLHRLRPLAGAIATARGVSPASVLRSFSTNATSSSLKDPSPNWSNRPPKETILLDGCDFEHWLVVMEPPEGEPTRDDIIDSYIKTLAQVVGRWSFFLLSLFLRFNIPSLFVFLSGFDLRNEDNRSDLVWYLELFWVIFLSLWSLGFVLVY